MRIYHSRDCRHSPLFPCCNCGAVEAKERLEQLEEERATIERLINDAEVIVTDSNGKPYHRRLVHAQDLADVLSGRLR